MHMPTKWGVLVLIVVAVCLGAYYVLVVQSERVGDWRVYQGSGRTWRDSLSTVRALDVSYTVKHPQRPLFSYMCLRPGSRLTPPSRVVLEYQSEWPVVLLVVVSERDGSVYQARLELVHTEKWTRLVLAATDFKLRGVPGNSDENGRLDLDQLAARVDFYDGSGVVAPSTAFSNRLKLTPPAFPVTPKP